MESSQPRTDFRPVRAAIFDMDGLLIDSEDAYTRVTNQILRENGREDLPWKIKAQLQGRPGPQSGRIFREWAKLSISEEDFMTRQKELQAVEFQKCQPLPGVPDLLRKLNSAWTVPHYGKGAAGGQVQRQPLKMAVATSSHRKNFEIKTKKMTDLFSVFPTTQIVVGDDDRVPNGRGKPLPDIYLLALDVINQQLHTTESDAGAEHEDPIRPEECLVFEDSVPGVEAGRRAGMRVVWCPHPGLLDIYQDRVEEVLAGRTGEHKESDIDFDGGIPLAGSPGKVGEIGDGWAEILSTLEEFDYGKYGIDVNYAPEAVDGPQGSGTSSRTGGGQGASSGITDKELEEITARADGKLHAQEEGTGSGNSPIPGILEGGKI